MTQFTQHTSMTFQQLLGETQEKYIGVGNPNAKILIISNEPGINPENRVQHETEVEHNKLHWLNFDGNVEPIVNCITGEIVNYDNYSPRFPYKGQRYAIFSNKSTLRGKGGTSRTWYFYQTLLDKLRGYNRQSCELLDFHDYCFTTDLSSACASTSNETDPYERKKSIKDRAGKDNIFFSHDFFQQFPIVIVATKDYVERFKHIFNPKDLFGFDTYKTDICESGWINIHKREGESPKLLLHTKHFSTVSNDYLMRMTQIINDFIERNKLTVF